MRPPLKIVMLGLQIMVFFAVAFISSRAISYLNASSYTEGAVPSGYFSIVAALQDTTSEIVQYKLVDWHKIEQFKRANPQATYKLPIAEGRFAQTSDAINEGRHFNPQARFEVLDASDGHQIIGVEWDVTDNYNSYSKYSTDGSSITPMSSRIWGIPHAMIGAVFGLLAAVLVGKFARPRLAKRA